MTPSGATNLAVKDIVTSLKFLQKVVPSFGGSASKITLAGQSSGGNMIRALLAVPSASSLFQSAIIQSDPMVCFKSQYCDPQTHFLLGLWLLDQQRAV
jgi:carboxylesterase type B